MLGLRMKTLAQRQTREGKKCKAVAVLGSGFLVGGQGSIFYAQLVVNNLANTALRGFNLFGILSQKYKKKKKEFLESQI